MDIMWVVNIVMNEPSEHLYSKESVMGGWLEGLLGTIKQEYENIYIITTYQEKEIKVIKIDNVTYYLLPACENHPYSKSLKMLLENINIDIIHIHGMEYSLGYSIKSIMPNIPAVISLQGILEACYENYLGNMSPMDILSNVTFKEIILRNGLLKQKRIFKQKKMLEEKYFDEINFIIGRTQWDRSYCRKNNKYFHVDEVLRAQFYKSRKWDIQMVQRYSIYISQANYPLKGFHYFLKALYIVKQTFNNVHVMVGGINMLNVSSIKRGGYQKYLIKLINKLELQDNITFLGLQKEEDVIKNLLKTNVFVLPSAIENSSNSLAEAMILGVPSICSNVGGNCEIIGNQLYTYNYIDYRILANKIKQLFANVDDCIALSSELIKNASIRHNQDKIGESINFCYKTIVKGVKND